MLYLFKFPILNLLFPFVHFFFLYHEQNFKMSKQNILIAIKVIYFLYWLYFLSLLYVDIWEVKQFQRKLLPISSKIMPTYLANFTVVAFRGTKPVWNWIWNIFIEAICWKQETGNYINPYEQHVQYSAFNIVKSIFSIKIFWSICNKNFI